MGVSCQLPRALSAFYWKNRTNTDLRFTILANPGWIDFFEIDQFGWSLLCSQEEITDK
jgi:hypothetical protein